MFYAIVHYTIFFQRLLGNEQDLLRSWPPKWGVKILDRKIERIEKLEEKRMGYRINVNNIINKFLGRIKEHKIFKEQNNNDYLYFIAQAFYSFEGC